MGADRNEHHVECVAEWMHDKPSKAHELKLLHAREIDTVATAAVHDFGCFGELTNINNSVIASALPGCLCLVDESCMMCCDPPEAPEPEFSLWDHLVALSKASFRATPKRKQPDSFDASHNSQPRTPLLPTPLSLADSLKRMKLDDLEDDFDVEPPQAQAMVNPDAATEAENGEPMPSQRVGLLDSLLQEDKFSRRF